MSPFYPPRIQWALLQDLGLAAWFCCPSLAISTFDPLYVVVEQEPPLLYRCGRISWLPSFPCWGLKAQCTVRPAAAAPCCGVWVSVILSRAVYTQFSISPVPSAQRTPVPHLSASVSRRCRGSVVMWWSWLLEQTTFVFKNNRIVFCFQRFLLGIFLFEQDLLLFCITVWCSVGANL